MKLGYKLFIGFFLISAIGFYALSERLVSGMVKRYREAIEEPLVDTAHLFAGIFSLNYQNNKIEFEKLDHAIQLVYQRNLSAKIYELLKTKVNLRIYVTDTKGIVKYDSWHQIEGQDYSEWNDIYLTLQGKYGARSTREDPEDDESSILYVAAPILIDDKIVGVVSVGKPADSVTLFITNAKYKVILSGILVFIGTILLSLLLTWLLTRPILKLTRYAVAAKSDRRIPFPKLGTDEVGTLGGAFKALVTTLEGKKYVEQYVQTLTHEIESPVAAIQGAAELLAEKMGEQDRKKFINNIKTESVRIQTMVEKLLLLASLENRTALEKITDINLSIMVSEIVESMQPQFMQKRLTVDFKTAENINFPGEKFLIRQAITNILQNAVKFCKPAGHIQIELQKQTDNIQLAVIDDGAGIPEFARDKIFDKFYSLEPPGTRKKSSGLGLNFVKEVMDLHNGQIEINANKPQGVRANLRFPV